MSPELRASKRQPDATHVLFVVHGIGPTCGPENLFLENVSGFRKSIKKVLKHEKQYQNVNAELIPIEWHTSLHELVDSNMDSISLPYCPPNIKSIEHEYFADVLYYFTQDRGQHIINTIVNSMNDEYEKYLREHPNFKGKFSIVGYSLGGVCCYDILCGQEDLSNREGRAKINIKAPKLKFKPHFFFSLGSPIAAVMVMRNQTYDQYRIPDGCIHHNIYHPFDPMAYRMEPMVGQMYRELDPVIIPVFSSSRFNIHLNHRLRFRPFCRRTKAKSQALPSSHLKVAATIGTFLSKIGGQNKELNQVCNNVNDEHPYLRQSGESIPELPARESSESYEGAINVPADMVDVDSMDLATLNEGTVNSPALTYRMDYALQEKVRIDIVAHRYMITLKAHFSYWEHRDVAHHILKTLHQNLDERPSLFPETEK